MTLEGSMKRWLSTLTAFAVAHVKNLVPHHSLYSYGGMQEVWLDR